LSAVSISPHPADDRSSVVLRQYYTSNAMQIKPVVYSSALAIIKTEWPGPM